MSELRATVNDAVRAVYGWAIGALALVGCGLQALALRSWPQRQIRLRRQLGITERSPILRYGPEVERQLAAHVRAARDRGRSLEHALTSGSTAAPKRIPFSPRRLRQIRWLFVDAFARACRSFGLSRRSLYLFASASQDGSLTSLLLREPRPAPGLALLQAPYRLERDAFVRAWTAEFGLAAVRAVLLALSNPGVLYATNPSTLTTFFDDLEADWTRVRGCAAALLSAAGWPWRLGWLLARGARGRLSAMAASPRPLPLDQLAPGVGAVMTWTGGYLAPFLHRLARHLPAGVVVIPMFSLSTETVATLPRYASDGRTAFLPLAPDVLYEFLPADAPDDPAYLVPPAQLRPGAEVAVVVSDRHGLRRYQTEDLFVCRGLVRGLPDLAFVRRRGLSHSFTGEKLTGEQIEAAFVRLRQERALPEHLHLTLEPRFAPSDPRPHYHLHVVGPDADVVGLPRLAERCQALLEALNGEYRAKSTSGRLGPVKASATSVAAFATAVLGPAASEARGWEGQFKFLPLTLRGALGAAAASTEAALPPART